MGDNPTVTLTGGVLQKEMRRSRLPDRLIQAKPMRKATYLGQDYMEWLFTQSGVVLEMGPGEAQSSVVSHQAWTVAAEVFQGDGEVFG
jgi:hypothetical protein